MCGGPPCLSACAIHVWIGWIVDAVAIRVMVRSILLVRRHCGESRSVSCSVATNGEFFSVSSFDNGMSQDLLPLVRISHQVLLSFTLRATTNACR